MNSVLVDSIGFLLCSAVIVYSGSKLATYGDEIANLTGWGKAWVGLIMLSAVTTLPELMTGISSVAVINQPDLAVGNVFGSCVFNLFILSFIDARINRPLSSVVKTTHLFAGLFGIILIALSGMAILLADITPMFFWVSPFSILLILTYMIAVWGIFQYEKANKQETDSITEAKKVENKSELKGVLTKYFLNALLVIVAAYFLPQFGEQLAMASGMGNTFFGTLFLAAATSLPELVVSFAAVRIGAIDLSVGNILGSNIFNIFILAVDDIFYTHGSIFSNVSAAHLDTVLMVIIMTAVVGLGLMVKSPKKFWKFGFDTLIIFILYILLMVILFIKSSN